jgi:hypothetical protein
MNAAPVTDLVTHFAHDPKGEKGWCSGPLDPILLQSARRRRDAAVVACSALLSLSRLLERAIKEGVVIDGEVGSIDAGTGAYQAILEPCVSKVRPVLMVALTTVLGSIPLLPDPFFGSMAVCIMFGLSFACVLTVIVRPVLYAIMYTSRRKASPRRSRPDRAAPHLWGGDVAAE